MTKWDPDDLPETYYILGTVHGFKFVLDVEEGARVAAFLVSYTTVQGTHTSGFLAFKDFTEAPAYVQVELIDSFYMSTPDSRGFEQALMTDLKKRGWNTGDDD